MSLRTHSPTRHSLPGPEDITRCQLDNGITVLSRANNNSPSVVLSGYLPAGALFDPGEKLGLADFTASSLMRGTARRSFQEVFNALESVGAGLGFSAGVHTVGFHGQALVEDMDLLLELLSESLRTPLFPPEQIERLRAQLLTSLAIRAQDTAEMASLAFDQIVYANHPYRHPEDGYPETVQAITAADLHTFHQLHYGPQGMVIALVGAIDPASAINKIARTLSDWYNPAQPTPPELPRLTPLLEIVQQSITLPGKYQTDLCLGIAGPPRHSLDFLPAALGNDILGIFGMMGRIGTAVREQAGLAYYAHSSLGSGLGPGPWVVSAGVDPGNVDQAIHLIRQEIQRFINVPVDATELSDSQSCFIGRLPVSLESNSGVAAALLHLERHKLGLDYYHRYPDLVRSVTRADILETAQRYWNLDRMAIAVAGP